MAAGSHRRGRRLGRKKHRKAAGWGPASLLSGDTEGDRAGEARRGGKKHGEGTGRNSQPWKCDELVLLRARGTHKGQVRGDVG